MYALLTRFLPAWLAQPVMVLWYAAWLLAITWFADADPLGFRYLEL